MAKDMGAKASTSIQGNTPKSKNKPREKEEAAKKRQNIQHDNDEQGEQQKEGEVCKKFIMVDEQLGMDITPLQTQYMNPPPTVPPDDRSEKCQMNKSPIIEEYAIDISEDEPDVDNPSLKDPDEDNETSELLIRAFSPHLDKNLADEIQQVASSQGLSPRGLHHERFKFQVQDINTVTAGRPNTRLVKNQLAMEHVLSNCNGKIWLFWNMDIDCVILEEDKQQITCDFSHNELQHHFTTTFVYANGKKFTWSNNRGIQQRVWKRLDRALVTDVWLENMPQTTITHFPSVGSDHCPLLMEMSAREDDHIKYFKFLNCWIDQPNFLDIVKAC
ncbi:hypothetical protein H5410_064367 [Solanum commersonii]|uniref:Endonuclease/exonuclease/phosphatase domain-containing protein n=1 Tax=Solanum commersonii TaxID=4109 RepID=A0A9J5VZN5_SOLCO|nr:hypothetical protein H5410_064367 [Solanum commersonii]